jgi:ABC-type transport system substrate-binding protein
MIWVKNPDYWQEGKPYLDGIEVNFIPDDSTARAVMLAGEADYWEYSYSLELEEQGFDIWRSWAGLVISLWPNTADPDSKWNDIQLRQALEYAIDKKAICEAFGPETFKPMYMIAPPGEWGYDPEYPVREYDPAKARQLVIDAGYPDGLDATLLIQANYESQVTGSILKNCLDAIGIRVELDLADEGRYFSAVFGNAPVSDLLMMYSGTDINWLVSYMRWFSTKPIINVSYLGHTDEQRAMDEQALGIQDPAGQKAITEKLVKYLTDNAIVIPIFWFGMRQVVASYVHGPQPQTITWHTEELWMEEH